MMLLDECVNHVENNILKCFNLNVQTHLRRIVCFNGCSQSVAVFETKIRKCIQFESNAQYSIISDDFPRVKQIINVISDSSSVVISVFIGSIFTLIVSLFSASS